MPALAVPLRGHEAGQALPALGEASLAWPHAGRQRVLQGQALPGQALPGQAKPALHTQLVKSGAEGGKGAQLAKIILYNRMLNIYEFNASDEHYFSYYNTMASIIKKINIVLANLNYLLAIYIYILKNISLLNKNNCNNATALAWLGSTKSLALEQTGQGRSSLANPLPLGLSGGQEGEGGAWGRVACALQDPCKILSDINSFFT